MSIDTRDKRFSILNMAPLVIHPAGDGSISGADRQQFMWRYSGIAIQQFTGWYPGQSAGGTWVSPSGASGSWVQDHGAMGTWVMEGEATAL